MNLLIVDDQINVLHGLLSGIDFEQLQFTNVFTATSADEALKIMCENPIQILLTDIEMPGKNGLELNTIVREQYPDILRIILTSHAVFSYAQESIKLGCFDYIVQPAPYEDICATLKKAVETSNLNHNNRRIHEYGNLFKRHENEFMNAAITKLYSSNPQDIQGCINLLNQSGYNLNEDSLVEIIYLDIYSYRNKTAGYPSQMTLMRIISDVMASMDYFKNLDYFTVMSPYRQFSILLITNDTSFLPLSQIVIEQFYQKLSESITGSNLALYAEEVVMFKNIHTAFCFANKDVLDNVSQTPGIYRINHSALTSTLSVSLPNHVKRWDNLLRENQKSILKKDIFFCLDNKITNTTSPYETLCELHQQLMLLFLKYANDNNMDINSIFTESFTYQNCMDSFISIEHIKDMVVFFLDALDTKSNNNANIFNYVERAKTYIMENYSHQLSVKEVSDYVHLNPEYFTKLFKKETGMNIKDFITDCRMTTAKDLLEHSNLSVAMVASKVGYNNFSYFAYTFKQVVNKTPSQYRSMFHGNNTTDSQ